MSRTYPCIGYLKPDTQSLILTLARRGRSVADIARALSIQWITARDCLDAWGVPRRRWVSRR